MNEESRMEPQGPEAETRRRFETCHDPVDRRFGWRGVGSDVLADVQVEHDVLTKEICGLFALHDPRKLSITHSHPPEPLSFITTVQQHTVNSQLLDQ